MKIELLPCPMCGEQPEVKHSQDSSRVVCRCGVQGPVGMGDEVESWNKRFPEPMNETRAKEVLWKWILPGGSLLSEINYVMWTKGDEYAAIDTTMTAEQLEAVAWWMKNKGGK